jgi:Fibrinogen beta and gamma chains, C-terminal globular domain
VRQLAILFLLASCGRYNFDTTIADGGDGDANGAQLSCSAVRQRDTAAPNGVYVIAPSPQSDAFNAFCDMKSQGGGWALVAKIDGNINDSTWNHDSPNWTDATVFDRGNGPDLSEVNAKYQGYGAIAFTEVLLRFKTAAGTGEVTMALSPGSILSARSMASLMSTPLQTTVGLAQRRSAWIDAMTGVTVQDFCRDEGVLRTSRPDLTKARLGIVFNETGDCETNDSAIGVGIKIDFYGCQLAAGACDGTNTNPAFAWLFVR